MAQSHSNDMHIYNQMKDKAKELSEAQENTITAGAPGENILFETEEDNMLIRRLSDDPLALRISIGEANLSTGGIYCIFRGDPERTKKVLTKALNAIRRHFPK